MVVRRMPSLLYAPVGQPRDGAGCQEVEHSERNARDSCRTSLIIKPLQGAIVDKPLHQRSERVIEPGALARAGW